VRTALAPKYYLFFNGVAQAYATTSVELNKPGSARPIWVYSPEANTFLEWPLHDTDTIQYHQLPILSLEIIDGEETVNDLSEFVGKIRVHVRGDDKFSPSISNIVSAWAISSKIVLDPRLKGRMIDTDAAISEVDLSSTMFVRPEMENVD